MAITNYIEKGSMRCNYMINIFSFTTAKNIIGKVAVSRMTDFHIDTHAPMKTYTKKLPMKSSNNAGHTALSEVDLFLSNQETI